jgi:hypothetical protein
MFYNCRRSEYRGIKGTLSYKRYRLFYQKASDNRSVSEKSKGGTKMNMKNIYEYGYVI